MKKLIGILFTNLVIGDLFALPDIKVQNFVLEEKQIHIRGYPDAFNPSIVRWSNGKLLLVFRTRDPLTGSTHLMRFSWLNESFEPIGESLPLIIYEAHSLKKSRAQDPKLIKVNNRFYIVYNNIYREDDDEARRMIVSELHYEKNEFFIVNPQVLLKFKGEKKNEWREKGWAPFDFNGILLMSYSLYPHRVILPHLYNDECEMVSLTKYKNKWKWGELRGGTPALLDGDLYLGFFHSSLDNNALTYYFMGAYAFSSKIPFEMMFISPEPIMGKQFYNAPDYPTWKPLKVVFPGGFVFNDQYIWVVYGRQDHESWVIKLDKKKLLDSLIPVEHMEGN